MKLYNYQKEGVAFLVKNKGGMLLDEQGLGKTIQAIETCNQLEASTVCVVCPAIMRGTWEAELKAYCKKDYFVQSYEYYTRHLKEVTKRFQNKKIILVLDESHYIKSPTSKRTRAINTIVEFMNIEAKILLTGTPVTRDVDDLFTQLHLFYKGNPYWCKNIWQYRKTYMKCIHNYFGDKYTEFKDDQAKLVVKSLLKKISLRRTKSQVALELPKITRQQIYVDINKKIAKESLKYVDEATKIITGDNSFTELKTRIDDEATHIASIRKALGIAKIPRIAEFVSLQVENNVKKLVVFCVHNDVINMLENILQEKHKDYKIHVIKGDTSSAKRQQIINEFQQEDTKQIIIANVIASGVGVTLTKSHIVVFGELDWTPANMMQAEARVHRITQTENVTSYFIIANESLDSRIVGILFNKIKLIKDTLK